MSRFLEKALERLNKLPDAQVRQLLQNLATEHELLHSALNSIPQGLVATSQEHRLSFLNKAAERLLPWRNTDFDQEPLWEKIADEDIARFLREHLIGEITVHDREFILEHESRLRILSLSLMPLIKKGRIQGSIFFAEDITEKRNKEMRLRRAESLASLTTLAAGVAHEIKNPLGSIGIHIQLIQKALSQGAALRPQTILKYLDVVNEELDRLNGIVVDFLFAVRPMDIQPVRGSLNKLVTDIAEFLKFEFEEANIQLKLELEKNDDTVLMDERYLKQAILNILKNSMYAMPQGGTIKISTLRTGEELRLMISDTGEGISEENLEKIFEPYFTTRPDGTGLGLTLVYKIVKEHGADIQVISRPGQGTTVTIVFPPVTRPVQKLLGDGANE